MPSRTVKGCVNWETGKVEFETPYWAGADYEGDDKCLVTLEGCVIWTEGEHQGQVKVTFPENKFCKLKNYGGGFGLYSTCRQYNLDLETDREYRVAVEILCMHVIGVPVLPDTGCVQGCLTVSLKGNFCSQCSEADPDYCVNHYTVGKKISTLLSGQTGPHTFYLCWHSTSDSTDGSNIENWDWVHFDNVSVKLLGGGDEMVTNGDFEGGISGWSLSGGGSIGEYDSACEEDTYYACVDWATGKFEVEVPDECFGT